MISHMKILNYCFSVSYKWSFLPLLIWVLIISSSQIVRSTILIYIPMSLMLLFTITLLNSYWYLIRNIPMSGTEKVYVGQVYNNPLLSKPFIIIKSDHEIVELTKNIDVPDLYNLIEGITPNKIHRITLGKTEGKIFEVT